MQALRWKLRTDDLQASLLSPLVMQVPLLPFPEEEIEVYRVHDFPEV